jgi:glutamate formiminotransferase/formiminotetrahydrofolate cyclodeaminase
MAVQSYVNRGFQHCARSNAYLRPRKSTSYYIAMKKLIECVPNISEGRDQQKIEAIARTVETVEGVKLLDIDPGKSTNRTVITFVGEPEAVTEAAFRLIQKAAELIDMRQHKGEHPRMGATDVCPFVPIAGVTMEEAATCAHQLGERVGRELGIPGYFYESAARDPRRKNLAYCRAGEYEGLDKLATAEGKPDFGPASFDESVKKTGAIAIGARDFLVAYNVNLNTTSTRRANAIAFDLREAGRVLREGDPVTGRIVTDAQGEPVRIPGSLKAVKGIGWYIEEYGIAQLSLNLTNISITPVHVAFEEAVKKAAERGIRVTGSEIVGLVPLKCLIDSADYFLRKQERSLGIDEREKVKIAIKSLGLNDLAPFDPEKKVIEYLIRDEGANKLASMTLERFADQTASESPAPGGGSVAAYCGVLAASLAAMVANLSAHKRGWDSRWAYFSDWAEKGQALKSRLMLAVDEDTAAFNKVLEAFGMPKDSDAEKAMRKKAIADATRYAAQVPLKVAQLSAECFELCETMAREGNPNSVTDAAVGALCARAAVKGATLNVRVNLKGFDDANFVVATLAEAERLELLADEMELNIHKLVAEKLS